MMKTALSTSSPALQSDRPHMTVTPFFGRVVVTFKGALIADTMRALQLNEAGGEPVLYIPQSDCKMEHFIETGCRVISPAKGTARYWNLSCKDGEAENAAWGYDQPNMRIVDVRNHVAFYPDKVDIRAGGA